MCDCIDQVNARLSAHNTALTPGFVMRENGFRTYVVIATEKINSRMRQGPVRMFATYCPFCGKKVEDVT